MTATELHRVITEALFAHDWPDEDLAADSGAYSDDYRDAARAVLAALTEAGSVEWGVRYPSGYTAMAVSEGRAREHLAESLDGILVSRLTLPWTAVR